MVEQTEEKACAANCKKFIGCKKIPIDIWNKTMEERDKFYLWLARECADYERT